MGKPSSADVCGRARKGSIVNLFRLEPVTGQRRLWRRLMPSDPAGVRLIADLKIAPEAQAYGYSYYRLLSQLYVTEGPHKGLHDTRGASRNRTPHWRDQRTASHRSMAMADWGMWII